MSALAELILRFPDRKRLILFGLCGALAVAVGFHAVSTQTAARLIVDWGYYYILGVFGLFVLYAARLARARSEVWKGWLRRPGRAGLVLAAAAAFTIWSDPFKPKVLYDEYDIQSTAYQMHAAKEVATVMRAYEINGTWVAIDTFLDKRPYFFPFLVSLLHDLTGYRMANSFILNAALAAATLGMVYWFGRGLAGRGPAMFAVGLLATLPLFGQNATGAGMDLHNLAMIALVACLAVLYLRVPCDDRLSLLVLGAILLTDSRYESVLFVFPAAGVIVAGWIRAGRVLLPWPVVVSPFLFIPFAWHNRVTQATPLFWQLEGLRTTPFSMDNIAGNLRGAWTFLFNFSPRFANSWYLSILGFAGLAWALGSSWRWARNRSRRRLTPEIIVALAFGAGITAHFVVLLFYWWARFDDLMAARFALPMCLALSLLAARLVGALQERGLPALRAASLGLGVWLAVGCFPAMARRVYTDENLVMQELDWEHGIVEAQPGPLLLITNKSTIPFLLWHIPALISSVGAQRGDQIRYHLSQGTFKEVLVMQAIRPTTANGDMGVDPDDVMPPNYRLETIAEKRFGGRLARISRLVAIEKTAAKKPFISKSREDY